MEQNDKTYIAHSANLHGVKQTMKEHSLGVGKLMREFALSESFVDLYEYCGLIHDMGKYSDGFQNYISGKGNKVRHAIYGAAYACEQNIIEVSLPVFAHHTCLSDRSDMLIDIEEDQFENEFTYESIYDRWHKDFDSIISRTNDDSFRQLPNNLQKELFIRMLYSSLIDADRLDTERHFYKEKFNGRIHPLFNPYELLSKLQQKRLTYYEQNAHTSKINELRNRVRYYAESKANLSQGFFSLTLPTGMGKTICSISWAIRHAQCHTNIRRIIIVLPFINIIDQTAEELKDIFGAEYVLEHHSNVIFRDDDDLDRFDPKLLATENWDYPIIITTSVQFFESLFSNNKSECRKIHNIQDAVIIFDEIQTLPIRLAEPTLIMLDNLQKLCRCSFLFCTATQPDFHIREGFEGIAHIESLVENPEYVFEETRRVTYYPMNGYEEIGISELADTIIRRQKSSLVVFNTKKKARLFFDEVSKIKGYKLYHLSTNMYPSHRKKVIKSIKEELAKQKNTSVGLEAQEKIIVSSTQLIEAGVDLDFPTVYRELAPLESIIQSAGRCNREGELKDEQDNLIKGDVYLFSLLEFGQPTKEYLRMIKFAKRLYKDKEDKLYTHDFYANYYIRYMEEFSESDELCITDDRKKWLFQSVADKYRIIDNKSKTVFVYKEDPESRKLYDDLKYKEVLSRQDYQKVSQYCVQVYECKNNTNSINKLCSTLKCGVSVWEGNYNPDYGLTIENDITPLII